ncbi:MAG: family 16 glycoside hydrolase [Gemmatimonadaceae bacterium]
MRITPLLLAASVGQVALASAQARKIDFERETVGQPPSGFSFGHTRKVGAPGKWLVSEQQGAKFLSQLDADRTNARFPVAVVNDFTARDVDLSVRFRPVSGRVDQAAGLVWRYADEDNYYIVRANAREDNVVLYKVEKGKRTDLPLKGEGRTYGKKAKVPAGEWSTLRVVASGNLFTVYVNGTTLYEVEDSTFTNAGKVGVWTKADSITDFDDLTIAGT